MTGRAAPFELDRGPSSRRTPAARVRVGATDDALTQSTARLNVPNVVTMSGYAATLGWLGGGSPWLAVYGIAADEADGRIARATRQTSEYGGLLDWAVDVTLTGLVLARLGWTWALMIVTPAQVYLRERGYRPKVGSARAALTLVALARELG